jgi:two-component system sensor histidine kinase VicK
MKSSPTPTTLSLLYELAQRKDQLVFTFCVTTKKFDYINPIFESMWGRTRAGIIRNPTLLLKIVHPEDQGYVTECYEEIFEDKKKNVEFRILLPSKKERIVQMKAYLFGLGQEQFIIGTGEDITDQKEYHDNLHKFSSKKNSILEILAHDLAGPLATIQGLSTLLAKKEQINENKELGELIHLIGNTANSGVNLIRDFVKQEFLETSKVSLVKVRVDLIEKLRLIIEQYQNSQQQIAKTFYLETSSEKVFIAIDADKFVQAINNLISNAIKFTHDNGVITLRVEEKKKAILIIIQDNGIGIPAHLQAGLFEKFTKARRPGIRGEESVGLGMSIIKTIVEWHQGKIWFESEENKGSTFYIEIPKDE